MDSVLILSGIKHLPDSYGGVRHMAQQRQNRVAIDNGTDPGLRTYDFQ